MPFRKRDDLTTVEDERAALRAQRLELETLKQQLAERVRAVEERERELREALGQALRGAAPPSPREQPQQSPLPRERVDDDAAAALASRAAELERRERELVERERQAAATAAAAAAAAAAASDPPPAPEDIGEAKLAQIEKRLAELREAEKAFLRTQQELADRSEAVAARERLIGLRERELDAIEDASVPGPVISELEARLRRLEERPATSIPAIEQTQGFSDGLRKLQQQGTRRKTP